MNIKWYMKNIKSNLKYLLCRNLYTTNPEMICEIIDIINWHTEEKFQTGLIIRNEIESLELLSKSPKSFCRFGDGEKDLLEGKSIPFQKYDKELADIYKRILSEYHENLYIGLNYYYFHNIQDLNDYTQYYYKIFSPQMGRFFAEICNRKNIYIDASFNQVYQTRLQYNYENYYERVKQLFKDKEVLVVCGENILNNYKYDIFEYSRRIVYENAPSKNAFSEYKNILKKILSYPKDMLICLIVGPTSKVLAYELAEKGYIAWDVGHLCKDYNSYKNSESRTADNIKKFYQPD